MSYFYKGWHAAYIGCRRIAASAQFAYRISSAITFVRRIVVIDVYKRFFKVFQRFLIFKNFKQLAFENNRNLKHVQKLKNQNVSHKIMRDFVFRFIYF